MSNATEDRSGVQVVRRVAQILTALRDDPAGLSLSQIASRTGLARSTVHRLVNALESEEFVSSASPSGRFRLGSAVAALAQSSNRDVVLTYHPLLSELSRTLNETVDLAVLEYDQVRFVHQLAASQHRLRAVSAIGALFPAYCTANGKALLATLPDEDLIRLLPARLQATSEHTVTDRDALLSELADVRRTHVAFDREEHTEGICAVGATVVDFSGRPLGISVPMPAQRFYGNEERLADALRGTLRRFADAAGRDEAAASVTA